MSLPDCVLVDLKLVFMEVESGVKPKLEALLVVSLAMDEIVRLKLGFHQSCRLPKIQSQSRRGGPWSRTCSTLMSTAGDDKRTQRQKPVSNGLVASS